MDQSAPTVDEEELLVQQRKERKELQAEIQKLKKSVSKGDKKKKKEITDEIAKLEVDLTLRHENELAALNSSDKQEEEQSGSASIGLEATNGLGAGEDDEAEDDGVQQQSQRKSKAQKRRDKKQTKDKDRNQRIQEQALENLRGPRQQELVAVTRLLADRGLTLHEIAADGNCMYNAIGHQLSLRNVKMSCNELREKTANYMRDHPDDFLPFLTHPDTGDMLTSDEYSKYCHKTESSPVWGGQIELRALSEALQTPIEVLQAGVQPVVIGEIKEDGDSPVTLVYQRHAFRLGEHYNSVLPKDTTTEDGDNQEQEKEESVD